MSVIYKAINKVNNKAYVGFAVDFNKRKREHLKRAECNDGEYFHKSLKKYGFDNFDWVILKEDASLDDEMLLIKQEQTFWTTGKGYNLTLGGEGKLGYITPQETKDKISRSHKGKIISERQLAILRANAQKIKETGHTEETRKKISESHKGRVFTEEHKRNISLNHSSKKETGSFYNTLEYKEKMKKALKGKIRTPEQKERYRLAALAREQKKKKLLGV